MCVKYILCPSYFMYEPYSCKAHWSICCQELHCILFCCCCYFRNFDFLIPDAPELIATFLEGEQDMSCKRNAFMMLIHADQVWEGYSVYIGVSLIIWAPGS